VRILKAAKKGSDVWTTDAVERLQLAADVLLLPELNQLGLPHDLESAFQASESQLRVVHAAGEALSELRTHGEVIQR
jgi:predicted amidohydrolase